MVAGTLLYIYNYEFSDGSTANKFFLIIKDVNGSQLLISLPTSKDYIPDFVDINHGCIDIPKAQQTTYCFESDKPITDTNFKFDVNTFLYGHLMSIIDLKLFMSKYPVENVHYKVMGILLENEYKMILKCFTSSVSVPRKFKKIL